MSSIKPKYRFLTLVSAAAKDALGIDLSILSRKVKRGIIPIHEKQAFINAGTKKDPEFHPVKDLTVRVVDMEELKGIKIVKFRHKTEGTQ